MYEAQIFVSVLESNRVETVMTKPGKTGKDVAVAQAGWSKAESGTADIDDRRCIYSFRLSAASA